jgi:hypothetical protein
MGRQAGCSVPDSAGEFRYGLARKMCRVLYQVASNTGFMNKYRGEA